MGDPFVRLDRPVYGRFLGEPIGGRASGMARAQGHHEHDALKHRHKHFHVTHYRSKKRRASGSTYTRDKDR